MERLSRIAAAVYWNQLEYVRPAKNTVNGKIREMELQRPTGVQNTIRESQIIDIQLQNLISTAKC